MPLDKLKEEEYWQCLSRVGAKRGDLSLCERISNFYPDWQTRCYESVAKKKKDASICGLIPREGSHQDFCYLDIAKSKNRRDLCSKIGKESVRNRCIKNTTKQ